MNNQDPTIITELIELPDIESVEQSEKQEKIKPYLHDESKIIQGSANRIFYPASTAEVATILQYANQHKIHITVSGGGTGLAGSRVPYKGWILATDKLKSVRLQVLEKPFYWIDPESNKKFHITIIESNNGQAPRIRVPVSMTVQSIALIAKEIGFFYPPDPTERTAFIGGNVATCASGARSFKYGSTRNYVCGMRVVLASGQVISLHNGKDQLSEKTPHQWTITSKQNQSIKITLPPFERPDVRKNVIGFPQYDNMPLYEIFVGTEGIFGVITEVVLQLIEAPSKILSIISFFVSIQDSLSFVKKAQLQREENNFPIPMSVEFVDENALTFIRQKTKHVPKNAKVVVYIEQDLYPDEDLDEILEIWLAYLEETHSIDSWAEMDEKGIEHHKAFRHALPQGVSNFMKKYGVSKIATDFSVPVNHFMEMFTFYLDIGSRFESYLKERNSLGDFPAYALYGHIGDSHLHFNFLPRNLEEQDKAKEYYLELVEKVLSLKGTIAAEHGVGKKQYGGKPYIEFMIKKEGINKIKQLKKLLDPSNILNRGNMFQ